MLVAPDFELPWGVVLVDFSQAVHKLGCHCGNRVLVGQVRRVDPAKALDWMFRQEWDLLNIDQECDIVVPDPLAD